jgi:hypothetical protein
MGKGEFRQLGRPFDRLAAAGSRIARAEDGRSGCLIASDASCRPILQ